MLPKEDTQLEAHIDHALKRRDYQPLDTFLQKDSGPLRCSKQLLLKLHTLLCRDLDEKEIKKASLLLNILLKFGKSLTTNGEEWLSTAIRQGLVEKMVVWFEKIREILVESGNIRNEALLTLAEDFFDAVMVVHDHSSDGKIQILENFLLRVCSLVSDAAINTFVKQEAVRKLNLMLDTMPRETRKKLIFSKEMMDIMSSMAKRILDAGDYDLQVAITEALCRMTSEVQRAELANHWFPMEFVLNAFKNIKDAEFETDCRKFLNLVNGMLGDKRRVFTFPCVSAHLENHKLQTPSDEKLEDFWIDFNVGTQSLSFYVSSDSEDHQWETVCILENEVESYRTEAVGNQRVLTISLKTPASVGQRKGSLIRIAFDSALDITDAVRKVFGSHKCKGFIKKQNVSVAKTAVQVIFKDSASQMIIPESQESVSSAKHSVVIETNDVKNRKTPSNSQQDQSREKLVSPSRSRMSEASINIIVSAGHKPANPAMLPAAPPKGNRRIKAPLEMVNAAQSNIFTVPDSTDSVSCRKKATATATAAAYKQNATTSDTKTAQPYKSAPKPSKKGPEEQTDIVPDTQLPNGRNTPQMPGLSRACLNLNKNPEAFWKKNEKVSVADDFISNKDKVVSELLGSPKTLTSAEAAAHSTKIPEKSSRMTKQPQEPKKTKNKAKKKDDVNPGRQRGKNSKMADKSSKPETNTLPDSTTKRPKLGGGQKETHVPKTKTTTGRKDAPEVDKAKRLQDAAQTLIAKIGSKYSLDAVSKQQAAAVWQGIDKCNKQTNKVKRQNKIKVNKGGGSRFAGAESWNDIYSFHSAECDNPTIELTVQTLVQSKQTTAAPEKPSENKQRSATSALRKADATFLSTSSISMADARSSTKKKQTSNAAAKPKPRDQRRHLFSDTDTDRGGDDSRTEISWLQDPASRKKPQLVGYGRHRPMKPPETTTSSRTEELKQSRKHKEMFKEEAEPDEDGTHVTKPCGKQAARPQRKAVKRKCYKEKSSSGSELEDEPVSPDSEESPIDKYETLLKKKQLAVERPQKPEMVVTKKTQNIRPKPKGGKVEPPVFPAPAISPISSSPLSVDQLRDESYDSNVESAVKYSPVSALPSPIPRSSSPEDLTPDKPLSISTTIKNMSRDMATAKSRSTCRTESGGHETPRESSSPASSHASVANINLDHSTVSGINFLEPGYRKAARSSSSSVTGKAPAQIPKEKPKANINLDHSTVSGINFLEPGYKKAARSSSSSVTGKASAHPPKEKPKNDRFASYVSSSNVTATASITHVNLHQAGPTILSTMSYLKHINKERGHLSEDPTEESHQEVKKKRIKLQPRRLFPETEEKSAVSGHHSNLSGNNGTAGDADAFNESGSDVGLMCQKISKEFTRKIQNRSRKMDLFTKKSLKSTQRHLNALEGQVRDYRMTHLEKFQQTILEEIENFEKDSKSLKQMEKDFISFWSQQTQAMGIYHQNEQKRIHNLKDSYEKNVCDSRDYEERIFTSEMNNLRDDMKTVQERLLKEMHEEELLSVRRGLESLFMAGAGPF